MDGAGEPHNTLYLGTGGGSSFVMSTPIFNRRRSIGGVSHTESKTYACPECGLLAPNTQAINDHITAAHNNKEPVKRALYLHAPNAVGGVEKEMVVMNEDSAFASVGGGGGGGVEVMGGPPVMVDLKYKASFSRYCSARADTHYKLSLTILFTSLFPILGLILFRAHPRFPGRSVFYMVVRSTIVVVFLCLAAATKEIDWYEWTHSICTYALLTLTMMIFYGWQGSVEYLDDMAVQDVVTTHIDRKLYIPVTDVHGGSYYQNPVRSSQSMLSLSLSCILAAPHALGPWNDKFFDRTATSWLLVVSTFISASTLLKRAIDCLSVASFHFKRVQRFSLLTHMSFFPDTYLIHRSPVDAYDGWEYQFTRPRDLIRWMSIRLYLQAVSLPFWKSMEGLMASLAMFLIGCAIYFVVTVGNPQRGVYTVTTLYDVIVVSLITLSMVTLGQKLNDVLQLHQRIVIECEYLLVLRGVHGGGGATTASFSSSSAAATEASEYQRCYVILRTLFHVMGAEDRVRLLGFQLTRVPQLIYGVLVGVVIGLGIWNFLSV